MGCGTCEASDTDATAVMMCLACEHARKTAFVSCAVRGRPIVDRRCGGVLKAEAAMERPGMAAPDGGSTRCPRGPDDAGLVRWMGLTWRGVPWPLRLILTDEGEAEFWLGLPRAARAEDLPGCGCLDQLKGWVERWLGT